jgi:tetratricopeptide (TPR) repeat protein
MKGLFGESWEKAARNAALSRDQGGTATTIKDEYDLLGVNHFYELFDKFWDKLFSAEAGHPQATPRPVKSKALGNLKAIKDGRDPLSHPVDEEISHEEAMGLLIDAKQVVTALGLHAPAADLSELITQLERVDQVPATVVRHLPPQDAIYLEFIGRTTVLNDLTAWYAQPDNRRCLLAGDGGKGKSAIAYRFAQQLAFNPGSYQLIIWLSAKRRKFQEGSVVPIATPDFTTADDAINRLLLEYGATTDDLQAPTAKKQQLLVEFLNSYPAFLIADDIDTVLDDYDVVSLFTHVIPHTKTAVLLTSRRDIPGIKSFVVKGFEAPEAETFIHSRISLYGLDRTPFTPTVITEILKVTDRSPLYLDDLLRLIKVVNVQKAITTWSERRGDEARKYALEREMEKLTEDAKKVLVAAAISDTPISLDELENILEFSADRLINALTELQTLFLIPKPRVVAGEQRFEINLNTRKLVRLVTGSTDLYARVERASKALSGQLPDVGYGVIGALIRQAQLRLNTQRNQEAEALMLQAIDKYPNAPDLHGFLGYAYRRMGRVVDARAQFEAAHKLKTKRTDTYLQWIKMELAEKEWSRAITAADKALKALPDAYEVLQFKTYAKRQAGFDFHRGLHREKAERMWRDAVEDIKNAIKPPESLQPGERTINAAMLATIVICLDMLGEFGERDRWLNQWETEHPDDPRVARQKDFLVRKRGGLAIPAEASR